MPMASLSRSASRPALLPHDTHRLSAGKENATEVRVENMCPFIVRRVEQRLAQLDSSVGVHHINAAKLLDRRLDELSTAAARRYVAIREAGPAAPSTDLRRSLLAGLSCDVANHDRCPFAAKTSAQARPIPIAPPVTTAVLSSSFITAPLFPASWWTASSWQSSCIDCDRTVGSCGRVDRSSDERR